jgi:hypothetical protein
MFKKLAKYFTAPGHNVELQKFIVRTKIKEKPMKKLFLPLVMMAFFAGMAKVAAPLTDAEVARHYNMTEELFIDLPPEDKEVCRRCLGRLRARTGVVEQLEAEQRAPIEADFMAVNYRNRDHFLAQTHVLRGLMENTPVLQRMQQELEDDIGAVEREVEGDKDLEQILAQLKKLLTEVQGKLKIKQENVVTGHDLCRAKKLPDSLVPVAKDLLRKDAGRTFAAEIEDAGGPGAFVAGVRQYQTAQHRAQTEELQRLLEQQTENRAIADFMHRQSAVRQASQAWFNRKEALVREKEALVREQIYQLELEKAAVDRWEQANDRLMSNWEREQLRKALRRNQWKRAMERVRDLNRTDKATVNQWEQANERLMSDWEQEKATKATIDQWEQANERLMSDWEQEKATKATIDQWEQANERLMSNWKLVKSNKNIRFWKYTAGGLLLGGIIVGGVVFFYPLVIPGLAAFEAAAGATAAEVALATATEVALADAVAAATIAANQLAAAKCAAVAVGAVSGAGVGAAYAKMTE